MSLDIGPFTSTFETKITELKVSFHPISYIDFDSRLTFRWDKSPSEGESVMSTLEHYPDFLNSNRSEVQLGDTIDIYQYLTRTPACNLRQYLRNIDNVRIPDGPVYVNKNTFAFLIEKLENGEAYSSKLIVPIPGSDTKMPVEGIIRVSDSNDHTIALLTSIGLSGAGFSILHIDKIDSLIMLNMQGITDAKQNIDMITDPEIKQIVPRLDTMLVPTLFQIDGALHVWDPFNKMMGFYDMVKVEQKVVKRNLVTFPSSDVEIVKVAVGEVKKPDDIDAIEIISGNHVSMVTCSIILGKQSPIDTIHALLLYIRTLIFRTQQLSLNIKLKEVERMMVDKTYDLFTSDSVTVDRTISDGTYPYYITTTRRLP